MNHLLLAILSMLVCNNLSFFHRSWKPPPTNLPVSFREQAVDSLSFFNTVFRRSNNETSSSLGTPSIPKPFPQDISLAKVLLSINNSTLVSSGLASLPTWETVLSSFSSSPFSNNSTIQQIESFIDSANLVVPPPLQFLQNLFNTTSLTSSNLLKILSEQENLSNLANQSKSASELVSFASSVLNTDWFETTNNNSALFEGYNVESIRSSDPSILGGAQNANLSSIIYNVSERSGAQSKTRKSSLTHSIQFLFFSSSLRSSQLENFDALKALGQTLVHQGSGGDVAFFVVDGVQNGILVRTFVFKGFDATGVDIETASRFANNIARATPKPLPTSPNPQILFHSGLTEISLLLFDEIKPYLANIADNHKIVLTGHSVGGSVATILAFLISSDEALGPSFISKHVQNVFTFGAPPICTFVDVDANADADEDANGDPILTAYKIDNSIVKSFVQPWDPVPRLFSCHDPAYPLVGDIGIDGKTLYASGPSRVLRPLLRAIFTLDETRWDALRDNYTAEGRQELRSVGQQVRCDGVAVDLVIRLFLSFTEFHIGVKLPLIWTVMQILLKSSN